MAKLKKLCAIVMVIVLAFSVTPDSVFAAKKAKISKTKATIYVGKTIKLKVKNNKKWNDVKTSIDSTDWEEDEKRRHLIAARYLSSLDKGENALELCLALEENFELEAGNEHKKIFNVPLYIHNALEWLLR